MYYQQHIEIRLIALANNHIIQKNDTKIKDIAFYGRFGLIVGVDYNYHKTININISLKMLILNHQIPS